MDKNVALNSIFTVFMLKFHFHTILINHILWVYSYTVRQLRTYAAENLGGQVLIKLANDDSHIIVLKKKKE